MNKWVSIVIAASLVNVCIAQTTPMTKKEKTVVAKNSSSKISPIKFSMAMLDGDHFDPKYTGFPISEVIGKIEKLSGQKKGEFESTNDFNARKAAALGGKFLGDSKVEDDFAFVAPVSKGGSYISGLVYDFDADTGELSLFALAKTSSMNGIGAPDYPATIRVSSDLDRFDLDFIVNSTKTYRASNSFGATIKVEATVSTQLGIAANKIPFLNYTRNISYVNSITPSVKLHMENAKAAKELPALKALIVMKLSDPYVVYDYMNTKPTLDRPIESTTQGKYLTGDVLGIVFYSGVTGEVFARLPNEFGNK